MNLYALMRLAAPTARAARPSGKRSRAAAARTRTWPFGGRGGLVTGAAPATSTAPATATATATAEEPPCGV